LNQLDGTPVPANRIQAGQHEVYVHHDGSPPTSAQVQPLAAPTVSEGRVWFTITWASGVSSGDVFEIRFPGIIVTNLDGTTHTLPTQYFWGRLTELGTVAANITAIKADIETGPNALSQVRTDIAAVDAVVDRIEADTTSTETKVDGVNATLALIKAKTDLITSTPAGSGTAMTLAADSITASVLAADAVTEVQSGLATASNLAAAKAVVDAVKLKTDLIPASPAAVGSAMTLADDAVTAAKIAANAIGATEIADAAITAAKLGADAITEAKIADNAIAAEHLAATAIAKILATAIGANTVNGSLASALTKSTTASTFDRSTDSLEALRDRLDAIYGAGATTTVQAIFDEVAQEKVSRVAFGSSVQDGAEKVLYSQSGSVPFRFEGGWIRIPSTISGQTVTVRIYAKLLSTDAAFDATTKLSEVALTAAGTYFVPSQFPIGGATYKAIIPAWWNQYGIQISVQQAAQGNGWLTLPYEFYDNK
jgi:hypothetical protein